jgi:hypothetical protein
MALEAHVDELSAKHRNLDKLIREAEAHPSTDTMHIVELKRQKLVLKDRLARLRTSYNTSR